MRAYREYHGLSLLHALGEDLAARPVGLDESCSKLTYPTVIYEWISGENLGDSPRQDHWRALISNYRQLHHLRKPEFPDAGLPNAFFHWMDRTPYLAELDDFLRRYGVWLRRSVHGAELLERLEHLVRWCKQIFSETDLDLSEGAFPLCFCRVDPSNGNVIVGEDGRLRWVDWEYCGWGDPALDLADLRWHVNFMDVNQDVHDRLRADYGNPEDDPTFRERLFLWDTLSSVRWPLLVLRLLWSQENGPDRQRLTQPVVAPPVLWGRLDSLVERAETWNGLG
jgi:thiamine kinase-like enzyme